MCPAEDGVARQRTGQAVHQRKIETQSRTEVTVWSVGRIFWSEEAPETTLYLAVGQNSRDTSSNSTLDRS